MKQYKFTVILFLLVFIGTIAMGAGSVLSRYSEKVEFSFETEEAFFAIRELEDLDALEYSLIRNEDRINYNLGVYYFERGQYSRSILHFEKVINASGSSEMRAKAHYNIGVVFFALFRQSRESSNLQLAIGRFQEALRENPYEEDARYNLEKLFQRISLGQLPGGGNGPGGDEHGEGIPDEDF